MGRECERDEIFEDRNLKEKWKSSFYYIRYTFSLSLSLSLSLFYVSLSLSFSLSLSTRRETI